MTYRRRTHLPARFVILCVVVQFLFIGLASIAAVEAKPRPDPASLRFDIIVKAQVQAAPKKVYAPMWTAPYVRALPSGASWVDGDRDGYRAAVMFLKDSTTTVGRVTFVGGYSTQVSQITDRYMSDTTVRLYDGSVFLGGEGEADDIPVFPAHGLEARPDERPVIRFLDPDGVTLETRDYQTTVASPGTVFNLISVIDEPFLDQGARPGSLPHWVYNRVVVGAFYNGKETVNVYYDTLFPEYTLTVDLGSVVPTTAT